MDLPSVYIFHQDNDSKHTAEMNKHWLIWNVPKQLHTPPQSSDLNPIKHLWSKLKENIHKNTISSKEHLKTVVLEEWRNFTRQQCKTFVNSMQRRRQAVIKARGYATSWLFNDAVSTTMLFSVDEIGDSEMVFGEMRPRIRHRLPGIHITVGENLGKNPTRKIFGAKRDEVTGEWRKLHNTELHALYSSPDIIRNIKSRRLRWAGHVARMGESRNAYGVLVGRPEGKRPLGRPRRRWEDNIKMDLREVGYDDRDWINLAQDRDQWRA
ncbi:hypothetical protein ANN_07392 [Periplaneta americana]|uniref:Tc1-like transposase DDE domain-containing protein n=1 Tax=Periplaneta americana TaxID=6978 RepID=A0ABQ8SYH5_PERAM|nr:hypothetical protein ANN_07392 [Periplaneta americana]